MQEVFEKIKVMLAEQYRKNRYESHNDEWNVGIDQAEQIVNEVAAEYNNGWIPCSERLPDTDDSGYAYVMVSMDDEFIATTDYVKGEGFSLWAESGEVIAWQPLPVPYKPKEEEKC